VKTAHSFIPADQQEPSFLQEVTPVKQFFHSFAVSAPGSVVRCSDFYEDKMIPAAMG